jgi:hypothetical protein
MFLKLQRGVSKGDPRHIDTAVRVLAHKAKLNGYAVEPEQGSVLPGFYQYSLRRREKVMAPRPEISPNIEKQIADAVDC